MVVLHNAMACCQPTCVQPPHSPILAADEGEASSLSIDGPEGDMSRYDQALPQRYGSSNQLPAWPACQTSYSVFSSTMGTTGTHQMFWVLGAGVGARTVDNGFGDPKQASEERLAV